MSLHEGFLPQRNLCIYCHVLTKFQTKFQKKLVFMYCCKKIHTKKPFLLHTNNNLEVNLVIEKAYEEALFPIWSLPYYTLSNITICCQHKCHSRWMVHCALVVDLYWDPHRQQLSSCPTLEDLHTCSACQGGLLPLLMFQSWCSQSIIATHP